MAEVMSRASVSGDQDVDAIDQHLDDLADVDYLIQPAKSMINNDNDVESNDDDDNDDDDEEEEEEAQTKKEDSKSKTSKRQKTSDTDDDDEIMKTESDETNEEQEVAEESKKKDTKETKKASVLKPPSKAATSSKSKTIKKSEIAAAKSSSNDEIAKETSWKDNMPYVELCHVFEKIEAITGRLDIQSLLTDLFRKILSSGSPKDMYDVIYLASNSVAPSYECIELGIGDAILIKAIGEAYGTNPCEFHCST